LSISFKSKCPPAHEEELPDQSNEDSSESYYYDDATGYEKYEETEDDEDDEDE
jgi:hypothetical protein